MAVVNKKCRFCRREGTKLFLKGDRCFSQKCPLEKRGAVPPGIHGLKISGKKRTEFNQQLREKQKLKRYYCVSENFLRKIFSSVSKERSLSGFLVLSFLERRLDNVVYRFGFSPSRLTARQLVRHGHVFVNGKKIKIPSFIVKEGDEISLSPKAVKNKKISVVLERKDVEIPNWLERKGYIGRVVSLPKREDISFNINESLVIEFYSR